MLLVTALQQRIVTAVVLIGLLLPAFLLLPSAFGATLIALLTLGAAWEWSAFLGSSGHGQRLLYVAFMTVLLALSANVVALPSSMQVVAACALLWWGAAFVLILRYPLSLRPGIAALCGVLVLLPAWACLLALLLTSANGRSLLLLLLAIVWAADVGAYFSGRQFGRTKLAPRVSPGKTWEGVAGGLACAMAVSLAGGLLLGYPVREAALVGLLTAAISVVGDLTVSVFKRNAGLKDSGNLFPGHGGILDRIDSVTSATPLFLLEASWLGWLA